MERHKIFQPKPEKDASLTIRAAVNKNIGGEFYDNPLRVNSNKFSKSEMIAAKLWKILEELTNAKFEFNCA